MDAGTLLVLLAGVLVIVSLFGSEHPLVAIAVLLLCVAALIGIETINLD